MKRPAKPPARQQAPTPSKTRSSAAAQVSASARAPASARIGKILTALDAAYPDAVTALTFSTPLELLISTILSAQATDVLVNKITPALFAKYRSAADFANADPEALAKDTARINFYRTKARNIQKACRMLVERHGGQVPKRMEELVELPGVARKTANVVLGSAFGIASGVVVDTHVMRVSGRLALTTQTDRDKIEQDLMALVPKPRWIRFGHQLIHHGRQICNAARSATTARSARPSAPPTALKMTSNPASKPWVIAATKNVVIALLYVLGGLVSAFLLIWLLIWLAVSWWWIAAVLLLIVAGAPIAGATPPDWDRHVRPLDRLALARQRDADRPAHAIRPQTSRPVSGGVGISTPPD
jgi:endonuclease-3